MTVVPPIVIFLSSGHFHFNLAGSEEENMWPLHFEDREILGIARCHARKSRDTPGVGKHSLGLACNSSFMRDMS